MTYNDVLLASAGGNRTQNKLESFNLILFYAHILGRSKSLSLSLSYPTSHLNTERKREGGDLPNISPILGREDRYTLTQALTLFHQLPV